MAGTQKTIENEFEKARLLYDKGISEFHNKNYNQALNFFNASFKLNPEDSTQIYIKRCKKFIVNNESSHNKKETKTTPNQENNNNTNHTFHRSKSAPQETEQDRECLKIIKKKDYYDILEVQKDADDNEIKKAYKKLAIKYHPDKNQSKFTEEAFKKISHAFTTLKDPEKRKVYDLYGSEEEIREKQAQNNHRGNHFQDDVDPFDLFEMFFNGGSFNQNVHFRRTANNNRNTGQNNQRRENEGNKPYYQFSRDEEFYKKMTTGYNNINYYVGDRFIHKYNKLEEINKLEFSVERDYLNFLAKKCNEVMQYKNDLEYKAAYYRHSSHYAKLKQELQNLDNSKCNEYHKLKNVVR